MQALHEVPDRSPAVLGLADKSRELPRQARRRLVDRVHEHVAHRAGDGGGEKEDDNGGDPTSDPAALHKAHRRMQERTEEQRHEYEQHDDPEPPQERETEADTHDRARGDEGGASHTQVLRAPTLGDIALPVGLLLGHHNQSTPCNSAKA